MRVVRIVAWVLAFVAVGAAVASWLTPRPDLDRADAADTAVGALESVGIEGTVAGRIEPSVHTPEDDDPVDVWVVPVDVDGGQVELRVQQSVGQLVYVDDRIGPDDTERLLTDEQFETMGEYRDDATTRRWTIRNAAASVAALLVLVVSRTIAKGSFRSHRLQEPH